MPAPSASHNTLAYWLTQILVKHNQSNKLDLQALAEEFEVHPRTIQRGPNERFTFLPLKRKGDRYVLQTSYLSKFNWGNQEHIAGVRGLYLSLSKRIAHG